MSGDLYLGRLFGIPFRLHWSWFLAVFLIGWTLASGFFPGTLPDYADDRGAFWALGVIAALGLFVSILLHEMGHALVARRLAVPVRGIRLFVFGGVAEITKEPKKPGHEILIALAGPAVTLLLIVVYNVALSLILNRTDVDASIQGGLLVLQGGTLAGSGAAALLFYLAMINTVILIFNMIPAFPLDGGRVFRGIVWAVTGSFLKGTRVAAFVGIGFSWLLFLGGFFSAFNGNLLGGLWLFFLATFLQNAARSSIAYAQLEELLGDVRVADMMNRNPVTVDARLTLREVADEYFLRHPFKAYPVVEDGRFLGLLTLRAIQRVTRDQWDVVRTGDLMTRGEVQLVVTPDEPVLQALRKLAQNEVSRAAVVENGALVGLLCSRDVLELMENRAGLTPHTPMKAA